MPVDTNSTKWYVYLIRCANNSLYTGVSTDPERRLKEHQSGKGRGAKSLRGKGPLELVHTILCANRSHAQALEALIKTLRKTEKESLIP